MAEALHLLVIDDSEDDRMLYRRILQKSGAAYEIAEANDGSEGVKSIGKTMPDCVLLDYSMPGYDGIEVLKQIRLSHPHLPVIMLTGLGDEKIHAAASQAGAQGYIAKGEVTVEALTKVIRNATQPSQPLANVLLVDDGEADLELTRIKLIQRPKLQCNLFIAHNGQEALEFLRSASNPIDLVLLDINMPDLNGFEILERMRADNNLGRVQVIMCTGSLNDQDVERAHALGATGYFVKPAMFEQLQHIIEKSTLMRLDREGDGYALRRIA